MKENMYPIAQPLALLGCVLLAIAIHPRYSAYSYSQKTLSIIPSVIASQYQVAYRIVELCYSRQEMQ